MPKSKYKKKKEMYMSGGSIMVPPEREEYAFGGVIKFAAKVAKVQGVGKNAEKLLDTQAGQKALETGMQATKTLLKENDIPFSVSNKNKEIFIKDEVSDAKKAQGRRLFEQGQEKIKRDKQVKLVQGAVAGATIAGTSTVFTGEDLPKKDRTAFEKKFREARNAGKKTFMFQGTEYNTNLREEKAEGGSLMMPPEMMNEEESIQEPMMDVPEDTYPNATPEELENAQEPDEVVEQDQMEMVLDQALDTEEQQYLMNALEGDEQLSQIFDKVLTTASEFSGSGEVDGLGDGLSDSIPARLSDGEFVITKKATDQIGADNLQKMMDDAERAYDGGMMRKDLYGGGLLPSTSTDDLESNTRNTDDEIRKLMSLRANQAPSLR